MPDEPGAGAADESVEDDASLTCRACRSTAPLAAAPTATAAPAGPAAAAAPPVLAAPVEATRASPVPVPGADDGRGLGGWPWGAEVVCPLDPLEARPIELAPFEAPPTAPPPNRPLKDWTFCGAAATVCAPAIAAWAWPWTAWNWSPPKWTSLIASHGAKPPINRISAPMIVWVMVWVAGPPAVSPSPSTRTPRPITKMMTKTSLETMRATIISIHLRTHEVEMSAVAPAKARGAKTAATMMSSLRTIMAPHTTTTAPNTMRARSSMAAGLVAAVMLVAVRMAEPICWRESPVATWTNPADSESTAASSRVVMAMAATLPRKATSKPRTPRASPPPSRRSTEAMIWMTNRPVATTTARVVTMARSRVNAEPERLMAVAPLIWPHSQFTASPAVVPKSLAIALNAEPAMELAAEPARSERQAPGLVSEQPISSPSSSPPLPPRSHARGRRSRARG